MRTGHDKLQELESELQAAGCKIERDQLLRYTTVFSDRQRVLGTSFDHGVAIVCAYGTLHPESVEGGVLRSAAWKFLSKRADEPAADSDADLNARLMSLTLDGYWFVPFGNAGSYSWNNRNNKVNCTSLPAAIEAAEAHRREPKPVWCVRNSIGQYGVYESEAEAHAVAARIAKSSNQPAQVLAVVDVVRP